MVANWQLLLNAILFQKNREVCIESGSSLVPSSVRPIGSLATIVYVVGRNSLRLELLRFLLVDTSAWSLSAIEDGFNFCIDRNWRTKLKLIFRSEFKRVHVSLMLVIESLPLALLLLRWIWAKDGLVEISPHMCALLLLKLVRYESTSWVWWCREVLVRLHSLFLISLIERLIIELRVLILSQSWTVEIRGVVKQAHIGIHLDFCKRVFNGTLLLNTWLNRVLTVLCDPQLANELSMESTCLSFTARFLLNDSCNL